MGMLTTPTQYFPLPPIPMPPSAMKNGYGEKLLLLYAKAAIRRSNDTCSYTGSNQKLANPIDTGYLGTSQPRPIGKERHAIAFPSARHCQRGDVCRFGLIGKTRF
jgi:hypothetical protein